MDDSKYIRSDMMVNDFELDYGAAFTGCPTPPAGVAGYLSILKPVGKHEMELRHNWLVEVGGVTHLSSLFCAGGSFVKVGDGYAIDHDGDCTVTDRYAGEEYQYTCNVSFHIDVDPF